MRLSGFVVVDVSRWVPSAPALAGSSNIVMETKGCESTLNRDATLSPASANLGVMWRKRGRVKGGGKHENRPECCTFFDS